MMITKLNEVFYRTWESLNDKCIREIRNMELLIMNVTRN